MNWKGNSYLCVELHLSTSSLDELRKHLGSTVDINTNTNRDNGLRRVLCLLQVCSRDTRTHTHTHTLMGSARELFVCVGHWLCVLLVLCYISR
jgi:hypothetical protein